MSADDPPPTRPPGDKNNWIVWVVAVLVAIGIWGIVAVATSPLSILLFVMAFGDTPRSGGVSLNTFIGPVLLIVAVLAAILFVMRKRD